VHVDCSLSEQYGSAPDHDLAAAAGDIALAFSEEPVPGVGRDPPASSEVLVEPAAAGQCLALGRS